MALLPADPLYPIVKFLADATNPVLGIALVIGLILLWRRGARFDRVQARSIFITTLLCVAFVYLARAVDARFDLWDSRGLNYSTHGALAIALSYGLAFVWPRRWWLFLGVFVAYCWLMTVLRFSTGAPFHTWPDLLTTSALLVPVCWVAHYVAWRRRRVILLET